MNVKGRLDGGVCCQRDIVLLLGSSIGRIIRVSAKVDRHGLDVPRLLQRRQHSSEFEGSYQTGPNGRVCVASRHIRPVDTHVVCQLAHPAFALFLIVIIFYHVFVAAGIFEHGEVLNGDAVARSSAVGRRFVVVVLWDFLLFTSRHDVLVPHRSCLRPSCLPQVEPPVPTHDKDNIEKVKGHHANGLPEMQFAVDDKADAEGRGDKEEANITDKTLASDLKRPDQSHRARHNSSDETCGADKLANSQARRMSAEGSKGGEHVRATIAKGEQCHSSETLAHAQHTCNSVKVDAEEVARSDADGTEEEGEPECHDDEGDRLCVRQSTVVEGQIRYDACFFVWTVCAHKSALVFGMVDEAALGIVSISCAGEGWSFCILLDPEQSLLSSEAGQTTSRHRQPVSLPMLTMR